MIKPYLRDYLNLSLSLSLSLSLLGLNSLYKERRKNNVDNWQINTTQVTIFNIIWIRCVTIFQAFSFLQSWLWTLTSAQNYSTWTKVNNFFGSWFTTQAHSQTEDFWEADVNTIGPFLLLVLKDLFDRFILVLICLKKTSLFLFYSFFFYFLKQKHYI